MRLAKIAAVTLPGTVEKIIKSPLLNVPDKAQIVVEGADELYRELRIENTLHNELGEELVLKSGAQVDVSVQASAEGTETKEIPHAEEHDMGADTK
jgi:hypothetical protein